MNRRNANAISGISIDTDDVDEGTAPRAPKSKDKPKKDVERYSNRDRIERYLKSKEGVIFLVERAKEAHMSNLRSEKREVEFDKVIDEIVDFYGTWAFNFPVKGNHKLSQYELLKMIEGCCERPGIRNFFKYLFD